MPVGAEPRVEVEAYRGLPPVPIIYVDQVLSVLDRRARTSALVEEAIDLDLIARNALNALGEHERVFPHLEAAERPAPETRDRGVPQWWTGLTEPRVVQGALECLGEWAGFDRRLFTMKIWTTT